MSSISASGANRYAALNQDNLQKEIRKAAKGMKRGATKDLAETLGIQALDYTVNVTKSEGLRAFFRRTVSVEVRNREGDSISREKFSLKKAGVMAGSIRNAILERQWENRESLPLQDQAQLHVAMGKHATKSRYFTDDGKEYEGNIKMAGAFCSPEEKTEGGEDLHHSSYVQEFVDKCIKKLENEDSSVSALDRADAFLALDQLRANMTANRSQSQKTGKLELDIIRFVYK
ncbi:MAG: hypothetical protein LBJ81_02105 [Puniceicoccales bacterium]|jgi:hypothetical protein|nr:hypothetical protein [Puniceicoccales bacterium]